MGSSLGRSANRRFAYVLPLISDTAAIRYTGLIDPSDTAVRCTEKQDSCMTFHPAKAFPHPAKANSRGSALASVPWALRTRRRGRSSFFYRKQIYNVPWS